MELSREELIQRALGGDFDGSDRTVDAHVVKLRQKLEAQHFVTVHGVGYKFLP